MPVNNINYQKELEKILNNLSDDNKPRLLLHSCCAPCSSYCLLYLREFFDITESKKSMYENKSIIEVKYYRLYKYKKGI